MKRLRSYDDDIDSIGEKGVIKDWGRRDQDSDRSSSHRRFHLKGENARKGLSSSSSYDRMIDDDRETSRSSRKRLDHESDGFERRKSFDRYRDCSDRGLPISSPRNAYGGERIHRSDSFSGFRREFPKGFRSERDRSRREESVSSWRRLSGSKDADEDPRSGVDSGRGNRLVAEDVGNLRSSQGSRDVAKSPPSSKDSGGEQSKSDEVKKNGDVQGECSSSSEMEEGELEPEPEPEPKLEAELPFEVNSEKQKEFEPEDQIESGMNSDNGKELVSRKNSGLKADDVSDENQESRMLDVVTDAVNEIDKLPESDNSTDESGRSEATAAAVGNEGGDQEGSFREDPGCFSSPNHKLEGLGEGEKIKDANAEKSPPLGELQEEEKGIDLEVEAEEIDSVKSKKELMEENRAPGITLTLIRDNLTQHGKDKGKTLAISFSSETNSAENGHWIERDLLTSRDYAMEGPSSRGFELFSSPVVTRPEKINSSGVNKNRNEKLNPEPLELSLALPNVLLPLASSDPNLAPSSPSHARSVQSLTNTFRTGSDGFTTSISFSGSKTFIHNPSCSLTQNSFENYEQSVGSHPIFQGVDQVSHISWPGQSSNETKRKEVPIYQRVLLNGNGSLHASQDILNSQGIQEQRIIVSEGSTGLPVGRDRKSSLQKQLSGVLQKSHAEVRSPTHSVGSQETRSEYSKDKKQIMKERSGSLFRSSSQKEMEQLMIGGTGFVERIITMVVSEPIQVMARRIQEMTEQSIAYLKESAREIVVNRDKHGQLHAFQKELQNRSDLTLEMLSKSHRAQLEILVAFKTGLQDFLWRSNSRSNSIPSSDLAEIFLNLKCRNLSCRSLLPVDECDCKVCMQKNGFCSNCMCLICSKFDMASNTCSWVGCDVCLHWCHTDCGLQQSYIRNGRSATGAQGTTEMQFHCVACSHPSEMFGFVKEVFKTCAKEWKVETLSKELEYVKRIFSASNDVRGKQLHDLADQMLARLENKSNLSKVYNHIMGFLTENYSEFSNNSVFSIKELPHKNLGDGSNGVVGTSQEAMWLPSLSSENAPPPHRQNASTPLCSDWDQMGRRSGNPDLRINVEKKPVVDELESIVRIKQAEAKMFQARADDARREAEGLKQIAIAKNEKIEEEYSSRITKLRLFEAEERRKQKLEELQVLERAQREYFSMKMRMEADIRDMLSKMEATKRNLSA